MSTEEIKRANKLVAEYFKHNVFVGIEFSDSVENNGIKGKFWINNKRIGSTVDVSKLILVKNTTRKNLEKESKIMATILLDHIFLNASLCHKLRTNFFKRFIFLFNNK